MGDISQINKVSVLLLVKISCVQDLYRACGSDFCLLVLRPKTGGTDFWRTEEGPYWGHSPAAIQLTSPIERGSHLTLHHGFTANLDHICLKPGEGGYAQYCGDTITNHCEPRVPLENANVSINMCKMSSPGSRTHGYAIIHHTPHCLEISVKEAQWDPSMHIMLSLAMQAIQRCDKSLAKVFVRAKESIFEKYYPPYTSNQTVVKKLKWD